MTRFKSQQVNLDAEPWIHYAYDGFSHERRGDPEPLGEIEGGEADYAPRPEFEPTRDPFPYVSSSGSRHAFAGTLAGERLVWAPRREQFDTPVNRVLVAFRADDAGESLADTAIGWLIGGSIGDGYATAAEIDHAHKVLTRLAKWKEQS